MNKLSSAKRVAVVAALVEGNSLRSTSRMTGVAINTVMKLLADLGAACERFQRETLVNLRCRRIQCEGHGRDCWRWRCRYRVRLPD